MAELSAVVGVHLAIRLVEVAALFVFIVDADATCGQSLGQMALRNCESIQSVVLKNVLM